MIYKGYDGTGRTIKPDEYAAANHSHNGANLSFDSTRSINDVINNNYSMIVAANNEISSLKSSVSNGKSLIASAITDKGVSTASDATFQTMSNNIRSIEKGLNFSYTSKIEYLPSQYGSRNETYNITGVLISTAPMSTNPFVRFTELKWVYGDVRFTTSLGEIIHVYGTNNNMTWNKSYEPWFLIIDGLTPDIKNTLSLYSFKFNTFSIS